MHVRGLLAQEGLELPGGLLGRCAYQVSQLLVGAVSVQLVYDEFYSFLG